MRSSLSDRLKAASLIGGRGARSVLLSLGPYLVMLIICLLAGGFVSVYTAGIHEEGVQVMNDPLNLPFFLAVGLSAIYLAIAASISISRERDLGTLEVLFHGPVDGASFVGAKYLEHILVYAVMMVCTGVDLFLLSTLANLGFSLRLVLGFALSLGIASNIIAFGILVSCLTRRIRASVLALLGLMLLFIGIQWAGGYLADAAPGMASPAAQIASSAFSALARVVDLLSPFSYMVRGIRAVALRDYAGYALDLVSSFGYSVIILTMAVLVFDRTGVRRQQ
jgi:ABC-type transport system involved in multi-copper enzyme maturation permease subunit